MGLDQKSAASAIGTVVHGQIRAGRTSGSARPWNSQNTATTKNAKYVHAMSRDRSKATSRNSNGDNVARTAAPVSSQAGCNSERPKRRMTPVQSAAHKAGGTAYTAAIPRYARQFCSNASICRLTASGTSVNVSRMMFSWSGPIRFNSAIAASLS